MYRDLYLASRLTNAKSYMQKRDTFANFGYFSAESESFRATLQNAAHLDLLERFLGVLNRTFETRENLTVMKSDLPRYKGALFWSRAIECCQASVILADKGMQGAAFSTLRTGWECLITACALWRKPELADKVLKQNIFERDKQSWELEHRAPGILDEDALALLRASRSPDGVTAAGWSMFEAANAAGLIEEYALYWRGAALAGAHATEFSIESLRKTRTDGTGYIHLVPDFDQFELIIGSAKQCLGVGLIRFDEAVNLLSGQQSNHE